MGAAVRPRRPLSPLALRPVTLREARRFVAERHRHSPNPPPSWLFGVGVESGGELVGVAMAGIPNARGSMDGATLAVTRTCTDGTPNANSMLYGAIARAARALGWRRLVTYTLASESGASLRAAGWRAVAEVGVRNWELERGHGQRDLWGNDPTPQEPKVRWELRLA